MIFKNCLTCNKVFRTFNSKIKKGGGKFCSRKCMPEFSVYTKKIMSQKRKEFIKNNPNNTAFKKGNKSWNKGKKTSEDSKKKMSLAKIGRHISISTEFKKGQNLMEKHPNWKGGITFHTKGYKYIYNPSHPSRNSTGYVLEHRLIMEKHISRYLTREEVVHHINHVRNDNRIENLMLFKNDRAHRKYHYIKEGIKKDEIIFDGSKTI